MKTTAWALVAWLLWWLVASLGCGGGACFSIVLFFYLPVWFPIVAYLAVSEQISHNVAGRWSPLCFLGFAALGGCCLLYVLKGYFPALFLSAEGSMVPVLMVLVPTSSTIALYLIKIFYDQSVARAFRQPATRSHAACDQEWPSDHDSHQHLVFDRVPPGTRFPLITFLLLVAAVLTYRHFYPTYSYRYKLTINIEAEGQLHAGTSVIEVSWSAFGMPDYHFNPELGGEAPIVDLGARGVVVATLYAEDWGWHTGRAGWGALWLVPRAFGYEKGGDPALLPTLRGKRELALDNLPRFLWFSDAKDPTTAMTLFVDDIPSVFGPSARFAGAFVEITSDPLVVNIREKLPWIRACHQLSQMIAAARWIAARKFLAVLS